MDIVQFNTSIATVSENIEELIYIDIFFIFILMSIFIRCCCHCCQRHAIYMMKDQEEKDILSTAICATNFNSHKHQSPGDYYEKYKDRLHAMAGNDWIPNKKVWENEFRDGINADIAVLKSKYLQQINQLTLLNLSLTKKINQKTLSLSDGVDSDSDSSDDDSCSSSEDEKEKKKPTFEEKMAIHKIRVQAKINDNERLISSIQNKISGRMFLKRLVMEKRMASYIKEKLVSLINHYIIDYTPVGNVIMTYSDKDNAFKYYCDKTVQRKILLVVCRNFCCTFQCVPLYKNEQQLRFQHEGKINRFNFLKNN
jgi:hypothetical protein